MKEKKGKQYFDIKADQFSIQILFSFYLVPKPIP